MSQRDTPRSDMSQHEVYTHGYSAPVETAMASRTALVNAGFLLPHLRSGTSLLDCGCGPGSTTADLAVILAPGEVVGIDVEPSQIAAARARAIERGVSNVTFEVGNIYELPFPPDSFDAVFGHTVIQHLREPLHALREMYRVLRPGGVIGLRDDDWGAFIIEPSTPALELALSLYVQVWAHNGGDPFFGRKQRRMLREAGFVHAQASASTYSEGTAEETATTPTYLIEHNQQPAFVQTVLKHEWANQATLEATYEELRAWSQRDDAFFALMYCEAVAWKPDTAR